MSVPDDAGGRGELVKAMKDSRNIEQALFAAASELAEPEAQQAFLDRVCAGDAEGRRRLEELLAVRAQAEVFFESPRLADGLETTGWERTGSTGGHGAAMGHYQLLERIGEGGCGVVYLAEQTEPLRRRVALKIIRPGMDTARVIARFETERRALALMDHPNIARVLDAGTTLTGRPFFVMELVEGERITTFCDTHRLDLRQRLDLFHQICLAIQHAHQKGVIHRDLKPSNVLVRMQDGAAVAKVIDFGIAKATAAGVLAEETHTAGDQLLGTPAYMSPEQAGGGRLDVDTRSDVYGLGALLYDLLCGQPPFDPVKLQAAGWEEVRRQLSGTEPPPPSQVLAGLTAEERESRAARRRMDPARLVSAVRGDLDWIVMKAMEKDRQRRYETVHGLALDLRRHVNHEPVLASPPGRCYRLAKLVRRNQVVFTAAALVVLALVAGLGVSTWLFFKEKEVRGEQERLRREADTARAEEAVLRVRAERRELVAKAAVLVVHGKPAEADLLLAQVPVDETPSSLEAANAFQAAGEWHLIAGRWEEAAERFAGVARAMASVDPSDSDNVSRHLLAAVAAVCQAGDQARYEWIRKMALERFAGSTHKVVAEQVLKAVLLRPAEPWMLPPLRPLAERVERALAPEETPWANAELEGWSCFSLSLYTYREGDFPRSIQWAERSLSLSHGNAARKASCLTVMAMAAARTGKMPQAQAWWEEANEVVEERFSRPMSLPPEQQSLWFDWVNARTLLQEAAGDLNRHRP